MLIVVIKEYCRDRTKSAGIYIPNIHVRVRLSFFGNTFLLLLDVLRAERSLPG